MFVGGSFQEVFQELFRVPQSVKQNNEALKYFQLTKIPRTKRFHWFQATPQS
jgi:hypothetical protein